MEYDFLKICPLALILFISPEVRAVDGTDDLPYCDVSYRVTKYGEVKSIKIQECYPKVDRKKYKKWSKDIVKRFRFDPKTINGIKVESNNERARILYDRQFKDGFMIKIFPSEIKENRVGET